MLDDIKTALAAAEQELVVAEASAPGAALRLHTGSAEDGDQALLAALPALRSKVETLRLAVEGAEQAELARKREAQQRALDAQKRACRQWLGKVRRAGGKAARALKDAADAYADLTEATRAAAACAPAQVRREYVIEQGLAPERVSRLFIVELARCVRALHVPPPRPWVQWEQDVQRAGQTVPLTELLGIYLARVAPFLTIESEKRTIPAGSPVDAPEADDEPLVEAVSEVAAELNETEALIAGELARMKGAVL